jgi:hypothetical protein
MKGVYEDCHSVEVIFHAIWGVERTMVLVKVKSVSNRVFNAARVSSFPFSPFNRLRLNRMYQFVISSISPNNLPMIVYNRYAAIKVSDY